MAGSAGTPTGADRSWWASAAKAVLVRPSLWGVAVVQLFRLAQPGWWRRAPFLPVPDRDYLAFRLETQYGSDPHPEAHDVVTYLHWCRTFRQVR
ncbi:MAG: hypothetical protein U0P45_07225 [Acidimicrobiales bacterium]